MKMLQRKHIFVIILFFIRTIRTIEIPRYKTVGIPALNTPTRLFLKSKAAIINKRENEGRAHQGRTLVDKEINWVIIVSAKMNPPTMKNNSPNKSLN